MCACLDTSPLVRKPESRLVALLLEPLLHVWNSAKGMIFVFFMTYKSSYL